MRLPLRPHSYDLTPHSYDLTPHSYDLTPHSYDYFGEASLSPTRTPSVMSRIRA